MHSCIIDISEPCDEDRMTTPVCTPREQLVHLIGRIIISRFSSLDRRIVEVERGVSLVILDRRVNVRALQQKKAVEGFLEHQQFGMGMQ
jgi:hypothetical protein